DPVLLEIFRERAVEMIMEGLRPDDLVRWRLGELFAEAPMNGMYVPALGDYDLNEDGIMDVCFYQGTKPSASTASVFVDVTPPTAVGKRTLSDFPLFIYRSFLHFRNFPSAVIQFECLKIPILFLNLECHSYLLFPLLTNYWRHFLILLRCQSNYLLNKYV
ncbi:hypothetical protein EZS27_042446, partial [termite gut metagenome]